MTWKGTVWQAEWGWKEQNKQDKDPKYLGHSGHTKKTHTPK